MKKGDLSLNIIIVAAILMIVLVVVLLIFSGRMGLFRAGIDECKGTCVTSRDQCSGPYSKIVQGDCDKDGDGEYNEGMAEDGVCCITVSP